MCVFFIFCSIEERDELAVFSAHACGEQNKNVPLMQKYQEQMISNSLLCECFFFSHYDWSFICSRHTDCLSDNLSFLIYIGNFEDAKSADHLDTQEGLPVSVCEGSIQARPTLQKPLEIFSVGACV